MNIAILIRNLILIIGILAFGMLLMGKTFNIEVLTIIGKYIGYLFIGIVLFITMTLLFYVIKQKLGS